MIKTLDGCFPLDWQDTEIQLGKFRHRVRRPTAEEIFERETKLTIEIEIGRDGSYSLPDPASEDDANAWLYDKIALDAHGYPADIPTLHKSAVVQALYRHDFYLDENANPFDDEIRVVEEIEGDQTIEVHHIFRQPSESELRSYRRRMQSGSIRPGRRGKQMFVMKSTLRSATEFYDQWLRHITNVTIDGQTFSEENRREFLAAIDPLIKRSAVTAFANFILASLQD